MPIERIESLDDPRIAVYRDLKDRDLLQRHGKFIAEGEFVVRRLLASTFVADSVFVADRRADEFAPIVPNGVRLFAAPQQLMNQIVGYRFHTGVIACGVRRPAPSLAEAAPATGDVLLVVCPEINNSENLGGLIRVAAGFGASVVVLGEHSCDPFFRQSIRVSMGAVFSMPIIQSGDIHAELRAMESMDIERVAAVLDDDAAPLAIAANATGRLALLFGNEAQGLSPSQVALCTRKVTIPMRLGTDSLNVAVSAGIILHHFVHVAPKLCHRPGDQPGGAE